MGDTDTIISAAQMCAWDENVEYNLREHARLIRLAAEHNVRLLVFPEMSVTGYVREAADRLAFLPGDSRLNILRVLSAKHHMIIIAGAPVKLGGELHIGSFIIFPSGTEALYTKHYLYHKEVDFYTPNQDYTPMILLDGEKISLAICFDIENPQHITQAKEAGCSLLISSIFYSESAMADGHRLLASYALEHAMPVLMSNFSGYHYHTPAGGQSGFWSAGGDMLACLDKDITGLVVAARERGVWTAKTAVDTGDVYTVCPVLESRNLTLRRTAPEDTSELLRCYSDEKAVPLFNSDNCNGDNFYYTTTERLAQTMALWEHSYRIRQFVRWTVLWAGKPVGTVEMFDRTSDDELGRFGILRIDLRSEFETQSVVAEILHIADCYFYQIFGVDSILTKAVPSAGERISSLLHTGYGPLGKTFSTFSDYFVKRK